MPGRHSAHSPSSPANCTNAQARIRSTKNTKAGPPYQDFTLQHGPAFDGRSVAQARETWQTAGPGVEGGAWGDLGGASSAGEGWRAGCPYPHDLAFEPRRGPKGASPRFEVDLGGVDPGPRPDARACSPACARTRGETETLARRATARLRPRARVREGEGPGEGAWGSAELRPRARVRGKKEACATLLKMVDYGRMLRMGTAVNRIGKD